MEIFKTALAMLSAGLPIQEDQCVIGESWWTLADSGRTSALVSGGWDELDKGSRIMGLGVQVSIPVKAIDLENLV